MAGTDPNYIQLKETEAKIHEQLYDNLYLLSHFYPISNDFSRVFKKDMFVKSNKAAFFEVIHYLFKILDTEGTKKKLVSWPPYDIKTENKFRSEVLNYINELNKSYDSVTIPHIMASHLISPGGRKFTKFMLKISQLVVFEHVKKQNLRQNILLCPTVSDLIYDGHITNINRETTLIEQEIQKDVECFEKYQQQSTANAQLISERLTEIIKKIQEAKLNHRKVKDDFNKQYPNYPSLDSLKQKLEYLRNEWTSLNLINDSFLACEMLLNYLNSSNVILDHNNENWKLPNEILHIVKYKEELDLIELFVGLRVILECKSLDFPNISSIEIEKNCEMIDELYCKYSKIEEKCLETLSIYATAVNELSENIKRIETINSTL